MGWEEKASQCNRQFSCRVSEYIWEICFDIWKNYHSKLQASASLLKRDIVFLHHKIKGIYISSNVYLDWEEMYLIGPSTMKSYVILGQWSWKKDHGMLKLLLAGLLMPICVHISKYFSPLAVQLILYLTVLWAICFVVSHLEFSFPEKIKSCWRI